MDDRKRQAAELIALGEPKARVAKELGVARSTVYSWLEDPAFRGHVLARLQELQGQRSAKMATLFGDAADVAGAGLRQLLAKVESSDLSASELAGIVKTITGVLASLGKLEAGDLLAEERAPSPVLPNPEHQRAAAELIERARSEGALQ